MFSLCKRIVILLIAKNLSPQEEKTTSKQRLFSIKSPLEDITDNGQKEGAGHLFIMAGKKK